jgi:hypothetical protein
MEMVAGHAITPDGRLSALLDFTEEAERLRAWDRGRAGHGFDASGAGSGVWTSASGYSESSSGSGRVSGTASSAASRAASGGVGSGDMVFSTSGRYVVPTAAPSREHAITQLASRKTLSGYALPDVVADVPLFPSHALHTMDVSAGGSLACCFQHTLFVLAPPSTAGASSERAINGDIAEVPSCDGIGAVRWNGAAGGSGSRAGSYMLAAALHGAGVDAISRADEENRRVAIMHQGSVDVAPDVTSVIPMPPALINAPDTRLMTNLCWLSRSSVVVTDLSGSVYVVDARARDVALALPGGGVGRAPPTGIVSASLPTYPGEGGPTNLLTGHVDGRVLLWDLRGRADHGVVSALSLDASEDGGAAVIDAVQWVTEHTFAFAASAVASAALSPRDRVPQLLNREVFADAPSTLYVGRHADTNELRIVSAGTFAAGQRCSALGMVNDDLLAVATTSRVTLHPVHTFVREGDAAAGGVPKPSPVRELVFTTAAASVGAPAQQPSFLVMACGNGSSEVFAGTSHDTLVLWGLPSAWQQTPWLQAQQRRRAGTHSMTHMLNFLQRAPIR